MNERPSNGRTIISPSGKRDGPPASAAGVPRAGAGTRRERDPQAQLSTAGLGSHSPGFRPHFAPSELCDLGQAASALQALVPSSVKLGSRFSALGTRSYSLYRYMEPTVRGRGSALSVSAGRAPAAEPTPARAAESGHAEKQSRECPVSGDRGPERPQGWPVLTALSGTMLSPGFR